MTHRFVVIWTSQRLNGSSHDLKGSRMSWLTEWAGKAEDFLNKVDQGAATLTSSQSRGSFSSSFYDNKDSTQISQYGGSGLRGAPPEAQSSHSPPAQYDGPTFIAAAAGNIKKSKSTLLSSSTAPLSPDGGGVKAASHFVRPKKAELDDELLFDFLNSSDPPASDRREVKREHVRVAGSAEGASRPLAPNTPPSTRGLSPASSVNSSSTSPQSVNTSEDSSAKDQSQGTPESSDSGLAVLLEPTVQEATPPEEPQAQVLSSLRLENQLLRTEVASLNQELASVIQRAKDSQEELITYRARTEKWNSEHSQIDRNVRDLRSQVDNLTETLLAKDGQLAVLRVRLEEADQILLSRSSALEEAQSERTRIIHDNSEGNTMHAQALQTLQERLQEAESALKREQDSYRQMQNEFAARLTRVEGERQALAESVTSAERRAAEDKRRADELQQQVKSARATAEGARQELQDYKNKASRILQSKEKLISSLKEGSGLEVLEGGGAGVLELEELRHEKELQRDEIQKLQGQVQTLRTEIQELESQALTEAETWREQLLELQDQQAFQSRAKQELEAEMERYKQELQYVEEELHRAKSTLQIRVKDREEEIQKLRNQLTNKTLSHSSQSELESRLHQLTETLIQKQTVLEALGTEKSSLVFQLERMEQQLKSAQGGQSGGPAINMSSIEGPGTRQRAAPVLFSDDSPGAGVYGKVRKAASTIDRFSIRLGIFLRRYPMARVFVILYMALLHLWVMVVLLTYTPEMHHDHPDGR